MSQTDDLLQESINALEQGQPLAQVLAGLPADEPELPALITLAAQTRAAAQPAPMHALKAQSQRQRVTAAARRRAGGKTSLPRSFWVFMSAAAVACAVFAFLAVAALAFLVNTAASAQAATLMDVSGVVESSSDRAGSDWIPVSDGDELRTGMRLRSRADSSATLVFFDGSRTTLAPHAEIVLDHVGGGWNFLTGRALKVRYEQIAGETQHSVVPFNGSGSYFEVLAPGGKAVVHGTIFAVEVASSGETHFAVERGEVEVSQGESRVTLAAGQATESNPLLGLEPASYQFFVQGPISAITGDLWTVEGLTFHVEPDLAQMLTFAVGDWVAVRGRILPDGVYQADSIGPARNDNEKLRFTGVVETIGAESWTISGKTVLVNAETEIEDGIAAGDPVEVNFTILPDGSWLAREIERLDEDEDEQTPTPSVTASVTSTLDLTPSPSAYPGPETATPEASATPSPTPDLTLTPEVTPTPEGNRAGCEATDKQHPEGLTLAARWGVPYEEIMGWFCQGFGFGEIDLAYELAQESGKPVADIFAMKAGGMGWGQIKQELSPKPTQEPKPTREPKPTKGPKNKR